MVTFQDYGNMYNLCWWRRECQQCIGRQYKQYDALVEQKRVSRQAREIKDLMTLTAVVVITVLTLLMAVVELNTSMSICHLAFVEFRLFDSDLGLQSRILTPSRVESIGKRSI
mmetsp:Transcript_2720/g.4025  ORF Transcript_2720/g.4025 Transcript_2720/m.4025 type:complete len:113 (-) Transcript_2720:441-779(-)